MSDNEFIQEEEFYQPNLDHMDTHQRNNYKLNLNRDQSRYEAHPDTEGSPVYNDNTFPPKPQTGSPEKSKPKMMARKQNTTTNSNMSKPATEEPHRMSGHGSSNKVNPTDKTPGVIIQHDLDSYDIINGNHSNNSLKMININTDQDGVGKSPISRKSSMEQGVHFKGTSLARVNEAAENTSPLEVRQQVRANLTDENQSMLEESIAQLQVMNDSLKDELESVIVKMEQQLIRIQQKRQAKIAMEKRLKHEIDTKNSQIMSRQRRLLKLKKEIDEMWTSLEHNYNIEEITAMEDSLRVRILELRQLKIETKTVSGIVHQRDQVIENMNKMTENKSKIDALSQVIAVTNVKVKSMRTDIQKDERLIKLQHTQVLSLEEDCKKMAVAIKEEKMKKAKMAKEGGVYLPFSDRVVACIEDSEVLQGDIKTLRLQEKALEKDVKAEIETVTKETKTSEQEIQIMNVKLKEKEQEVKLSDLKIKELQKTLPNNRLKPLGHSRASRGANRNSMQTSLQGHQPHNKKQFNSLFHAKRYTVEDYTPKKDSFFRGDVKIANSSFGNQDIAHVQRQQFMTPNHAKANFGRKKSEIPSTKMKFLDQQIGNTSQGSYEEHGPQLAEHSQRSRQRKRMGIKSEVGIKGGLSRNMRGQNLTTLEERGMKKLNSPQNIIFNQSPDMKRQLISEVAEGNDGSRIN